MKTKNILTCGLFLVAGIGLGWWLFGGSRGDESATPDAAVETQTWTCSMHPQIRQDKPGKCPLCAMDLIPLKTAGSMDVSIDADAVMLSEEAAALANIRTTVVARSRPVKEVRLYGTIQPDERRLHSQVSHVSGRIEKLAVNFAGEFVREGQTVASIYSPDLQNARQELLEALKMQPSQPELLAAAREKLHLWKLTDSQIDEMEKTGKALPVIDILAGTSGVVAAKRVEQGDYVAQGSVLFDLVDLTSVWALFDAYEVDLPHLKTGDKVDFTLQALPGKTFSGKISFIDPMLDRTTRTAKVRVETSNPKLELKPEMYANAVINASVSGFAEAVVIPKTAILWTGKRSIVYVRQQGVGSPTFLLREIETGAALGDAYIVLSGLNEGEEIVTDGVFSIDASAQLEGKRSMMNDSRISPSENSAGQTAQHAVFTVQGLCDMCKTRIETVAKQVAGVSSASWDMPTRQLHLHFDSEKTSVEAVSKAIAAAGHDTDRDKAAEAVYNALPDCCKYRK